jgi:hypothetical protein
MKYNRYFLAIGGAVGLVGFLASLQWLTLLGIGVGWGASLMQLLFCLRYYLPAVMGGEKPVFNYSLVTVFVQFTEFLSLYALLSKFSFWESNPQTLRFVVAMTIPILFLILIQMRLATQTEMLAHYKGLLITMLVIASVTFLFFLTPEKKLATRFFSSQPEKLKQITAEIEKRTPPPTKKKK